MYYSEPHLAGGVAERVFPAQSPLGAERPRQRRGKVTEIVVHSDEDRDNLQLLLPLAQSLSLDERWLTWITPYRRRDRDHLLSGGIDPRRVILLTPSERFSTLQLACRALQAGTCHALIRWRGPLPEAAYAQLRRAAVQGRSQALVLRSR